MPRSPATTARVRRNLERMQRIVDANEDSDLEHDVLDDWMDVARDLPTVATLTLRRTGDFELRVRGDNHCGVVPPGEPKLVPCTYSLVMRCRANSLDDQGFLVEQIGIHGFFQALPRTGLSCEKLTVRCARLIYRKVMRENPNCKILSIALEIAPKSRNPNGGAASMTFEWYANDTRNPLD